jgi:hypothetical protein
MSDTKEPEVCTTCNSPLDWYKGYYGKWSKCSNQCVKCEKGCYKFCECSKRIVECKECKFCDILIPLKNEICSELFDEGCCTICKGDCYYVCEECKNNCDTECECQITCISCENKFPRKDFISEDSENRSQSYNSHGQAVGKAAPICCDCQSQWCWCDEGPCPTPCTTCRMTCDECCGCECEECGETTEQGGCKCYSEEYINMKKKKDNRDMRKRFQNGQEIRHKIKDRIMIGIYDATTNRIVHNDQVFDSLSGFAKAHYVIIGKNRKTVNGWKECEYKQENKWLSTN